MKNNVKVDSLKNFLEVPEALKEATLERKQFLDTLSIQEGEERTVVCKISNTDIDMDGDMIYPMGCDTSIYLKNPIVLFGHRHSDKPIGKITALQITEKDITAKMQIADTTDGLEIWKLVKGGFLRTCSIGFIAKKELIRGTKEFNSFIQTKALNIANNCKRIVSEFILMENSLVSIPSNSGALIQAISTKSIDISDKMKKDLGISSKDIENVEKIEEKAENVEEMEEKIECNIENCQCAFHKKYCKNEVKSEEKVEEKQEKVEEIEVKGELEKPFTEEASAELEIKEKEIKKKLVIKVLREGEYCLNEEDMKIVNNIKLGKIQ